MNIYILLAEIPGPNGATYLPENKGYFLHSNAMEAAHEKHAASGQIYIVKTINLDPEEIERADDEIEIKRFYED